MRSLKMRVAFVLREKETREFDAEGVIDQSSPYKGTAERSSATKKPHKKMKKSVPWRISTFKIIYV